MTERLQHPLHGVSHYFELRFRFFILASGDIFTRYWQWFLLVGFLVPGLPIVSIFLTPSHLFAESLSSSHHIPWHLAIVILFEAGSILWLLPQKRFLYGGRFRQFARTLPLSLATQCGVSAALLFIVDMMLFIPVLIGISMVNAASQSALMLDIAKALIFIIIVVFIQVGFLENLALLVMGGLLADFPFAAACASGKPCLVISMLLMALILLFTSFFCEKLFVKIPIHSKQYLNLIPSFEFTRHIPPVFRIQLNILMERPIVSLSCYFLTIGISCGLCSLIQAFDYDGRAPVAIIIGMALNALILGKSYDLFREARLRAHLFLSPLPIPKHFWLIRDLSMIVGISILPLFILLRPLLLHQLVSVPASGALFISYLILLVLLRSTTALNARLRLMTSVMLGIAWAGFAITGIVR